VKIEIRKPEIFADLFAINGGYQSISRRKIAHRENSNFFGEHAALVNQYISLISILLYVVSAVPLSSFLLHSRCYPLPEHLLEFSRDFAVCEKDAHGSIRTPSFACAKIPSRAHVHPCRVSRGGVTVGVPPRGYPLRDIRPLRKFLVTHFCDSFCERRARI